MNQLITKEQTMSSYYFLRDIINPSRVEAGESEVRNNVFLDRIEDEIDDLGRYKTFVASRNSIKYYDLTFDQMMLVGMRESKSVRKRVLEKIKELENKNALPNFNDPVEAARAWADVKENEIKALELIKEQAPKVDYFDKVSRNESNMSATQVAQKFGMSAITLNKHLTELGIYNRAVKRTKTFSQDFINNGYGRMIMTERGYSQAVFTPKGEQYVTGLLTSEGII